jgi:hypothetical protein
VKNSLKGDPVNSQFMEFFGNYLIQAARWQKLVEQTSSDQTPGISDMTELGRMFQKACGMDGPADPAFAEYSRLWQQAAENFQSVFNTYAGTWGWVPRADYQALQEKCDSLENTIRQKDQIISQLRSLLEEKGLGHSELLQRFQSLIQDQNDEFQMFMKNFGDAVLKNEQPENKG